MRIIQPRTISRVCIVILLTLFAVISLYPIFYMGSAGLKTTGEFIRNPLSLPSSLSYHDNFIALWKRYDIPRLVLNTVTYIALSSALSMLVSIPASFAIAKLRFPFRGTIRLLLIGTLILPAITYIVPSYVMMARFGFVDSYKAVVLVWAATSVPGNVYLLSSLMRSIPDEILDSARLDGAGYLEILKRMVLPLSLPGLVTVSIFNVSGWWNDLLVPLIFLQSDEQMTVTVGMATIVGRLSTDFPLLLAGLFLASLPPMVVYMLLQRYIRQGLVIGSLR